MSLYCLQAATSEAADDLFALVHGLAVSPVEGDYETVARLLYRPSRFLRGRRPIDLINAGRGFETKRSMQTWSRPR
jgi:hypothetical protein